jgi:hypothetical protein
LTREALSFKLKENSLKTFMRKYLMFNLRNVEDIIFLITLIVAYLIAETLSGWFRAYVAKKMGDDTPAAMGFLSFNPLVHIDPIGMLFLIISGFGWGRASPLNPYNIQEPHRGLKLSCAYFSDTIAHLVIAIISLGLLLWGFGVTMIDLAKPLILHSHRSLSLLTKFYPYSSSLILSIAMVLVALVYLCVILAVLNFIINGFRLVMVLFFHESIGLWYIDLIVPILLILFFVNPLREYVIEGITQVAYFLVHIVGAL